MPHFEVELNGKVYDVEAPDAQSAAHGVAMAVAGSVPPARPQTKAQIDANASADKTDRARGPMDPTGGRSRAMGDSYTFHYGDELKGAIAAGKTSLQNLLGMGPGYSAGEAYDATVGVERERLEKFKKEHPKDAAAHSIATAIINPLNVVGGEFIGPLRGAGSVARAGMVGGGMGAVAGSGEGTDAKSRLTGGVKGGLIGAATGAGLQKGGNALAELAAAKRASPSLAELLADEHIPLTPGQMAGGLAKSTEDLGMRLPILGQGIRAARDRGVEGLNRAVANRALAPLGETLPADIKAGHDAVGYVSQKLGQTYDQAAALVPLVQPDGTLIQEMGAILSTASELTPAAREQFANILANRVSPRLKGPLDGQTIRAMQSELGQIASQYHSSSDGAQRAMADHIDEVSMALGNLMGRTSPQAKALIDKANQGWTVFTRMRNAASKTADGVFTPGQLKTAVRMEDNSVGKGRVARGEATLQDLSKAASKVLPDSFGNPGTSDVGALIGLGGVTMANPAVGGSLIGALGLGRAAYSPGAIDALNALTRRAGPAAAESALAKLLEAGAKTPEIGPLIDELLAPQPARSRERSAISQP